VVARAAFDEARELLDNMRVAEARVLLERAIAADPSFAVAHALLGSTEPGPDGDQAIARAVELASTLPEPERLLVDWMRAQRAGESDVVDATLARLAERAPGDWRTRVALGYQAMKRDQNADAITRFEEARALAPEKAEIHNGLAYAYASDRRWDAAIAAARAQVELLPWQPNPQDTLAEILLMAGRFDEAESAFVRAVGINPEFTIAWQGIGLARAYRGDYARAQIAITVGQRRAALPDERIGFEVDRAWFAMANRRPGDAARAIAAFEREAKKHGLPAFAAAPLVRAQIAAVQGKHRDALRLAQQALDRAEAGDYPGAAREHIRREALMQRLVADARLGNVESAAITLGILEVDVADEPDRDGVERWLARARGLVRGASDGPARTAELLAACDDDDLWCAHDRALAQDDADDAAGATATRAAMRARFYRDPAAVYLQRAPR
jgi:tetratricopeptide (TPR) repeat protein